MKAKHYVPSGVCLLVLIADLAKPGYGQFGLQDAVTPPIQTATRAIAKVEDFVIMDGTVPGCKGKPTPDYKGFTATQWEQFKKQAKGKGVDKAVALLGGKFCDAVDGVLAYPEFAPGKRVKIQKDKQGNVTHKII